MKRESLEAMDLRFLRSLLNNNYRAQDSFFGCEWTEAKRHEFANLIHEARLINDVMNEKVEGGDLILVNGVGCEIAREVLLGRDINEVMKSWVIYKDDKVFKEDALTGEREEVLVPETYITKIY